MPTILDHICSRCSKPAAVTFYPSGCVYQFNYQCLCHELSLSDYRDGDAYLKYHWLALRVYKSAERLLNCLAEFGEQKVAGQCLCSSCSEHLEDLDGAVAVYRELSK